MMKDTFTNQVGMTNNYLLDPFTVRVQFAFRNSYDRNRDDYKYRIAVITEKVKVNLHPLTLRDIMKHNWHSEAIGYIPELKKFRPVLKIQSFIDLRKRENRLNEQVELKRKAVVRDWWRMVLWYVRLRQAAKGKTPLSLIEVEMKLQKNKLNAQGYKNAKMVNLNGYKPYHGSDGESSEVQEEEQAQDDQSVVNEEELMS
jgi:hypothetical protein